MADQHTMPIGAHRNGAPRSVPGRESRGYLVWAGVFGVLAILVPLGLSSSVAARFELVSSDTEYTITMPANSFDAYRILDAGGTVAHVEVRADRSVDFYAMDDTGYNEYTDPNSPTFHTVDGVSRESAQSFTYSTPGYLGRILVVDNQDITASGASGSQPVTYTITTAFVADSSGPSLVSIALAAIAGVAVFAVIAVVIMRRRKTQVLGAMISGGPPQYPPPPPPPPSVPPLPPPPELQSELMTTIHSAVVQSEGTIERGLTPAEFGVLVQDFKQQKGKLVLFPVLGLIVSVVLLNLEDWTMSPLALLALLSPIAIVALRKYRSAIASGRVIEYRGVPTAVSAETVGKRQFYRVLFGTENLRMLPGLYGQFVQGASNTLAVFQKTPGQTVAIAVNGMPLSAPLNEPVLWMEQPPSSEGSGTTLGAMGAN